jgi:hypothetical protein
VLSPWLITNHQLDGPVYNHLPEWILFVIVTSTSLGLIKVLALSALQVGWQKLEL